jgi:hypothetical protein
MAEILKTPAQGGFILSNGLDAKAQRARLEYHIFNKQLQLGRETNIRSYKTQPKTSTLLKQE